MHFHVLLAYVLVKAHAFSTNVIQFGLLFPVGVFAAKWCTGVILLSIAEKVLRRLAKCLDITAKMDQLNVKEQQEFQQIVEQKQMKDFMRLYSNLVSRCFEDCVNDFTSANLTTKENNCISKCSEKFLKHSERVGQRFQEQKYVSKSVVTVAIASTNPQCSLDAKHEKVREQKEVLNVHKNKQDTSRILNQSFVFLCPLPLLRSY